jgi:hypothetical protein
MIRMDPHHLDPHHIQNLVTAKAQYRAVKAHSGAMEAQSGALEGLQMVADSHD